MRLRLELIGQSRPVIQALYDWSGFSIRGSWGMITSSWASHFTNVYQDRGGQVLGLESARRLFEGNDVVTKMQPELYPLTLGGTTYVYQRRASCCRYYLIPQGQLCASCPLVSHEERLRRNLEWIKTLTHIGGKMV